MNIIKLDIASKEILDQEDIDYEGLGIERPPVKFEEIPFVEIGLNIDNISFYKVQVDTLGNSVTNIYMNSGNILSANINEQEFLNKIERCQQDQQ